jgi:ABC-2 type transport system permease protein
MATSVVIRRSPGLRTVFAKTLRDQRRSLMWWAIALIGTVLMYAAFWPNVHDNADAFDEYLRNMPEAIRNLIGGLDFGTPEGYLQSELFSFMGPILFLVYAIGAGARTIAGEEQEGMLDLLLSTPTSRRRVLLDKFWALFAATVLLVGLTWASIAVFGAPFDLTLDTEGLLATCVNLFLLALAFGSIALAIGAATGNKTLAIGAPSGFALASFLVKTFAPSVDALEPLNLLSPFHYYIDHDPLRTGFNGVDVLVLASISVVVVAGALVTFERRDLAS